MFSSNYASFSALWGGRSIDRINNLLLQVHRRSVWQVIGIYALAGWVVLQIVDTMTGALRLPEWFPPFALILILIGFPMVIATAFVQRGVREPPRVSELPPGVLNTLPLRRPSRFDRVFTWKNAIGGGILAAALCGVVALGWIFVIGGPAQPAGAAPVEAALGPRVNTDLPAIAVLPLADLSPAGDFQYFADGVHEELLTKLSKVGGLLVLSRTSVLRYRSTDLNISEIAEELGAAAMVEGSVRRSGEQVRVTLQLIDAQSGAHLWADTFDGELTDMLGVQTAIANAATEALRGALLPRRSRGARP